LRVTASQPDHALIEEREELRTPELERCL